VGVPTPSKINAVLTTLLERKDNGCGKIVFCHYYTEIDLIEKLLHLADPSIQIAKFDGRVPNSKREAILSKPVTILLAQIKMCREGLNLQDNYSETYFTSPHFNPATEQQAVARCWRMGQQKEVHVFRYIMVGKPPNYREGMSYLSEASPRTMDMFSSALHEKKREFVKRMAVASASTAEASTAEASTAEASTAEASTAEASTAEASAAEASTAEASAAASSTAEASTT
jgi:hypothetical protein